GSRLPVLHLRAGSPGGLQRREQQLGRDRRAVLAFRRSDLDPRLHLRLPDRLKAARRTAHVSGNPNEHAEPNYWMVWLSLAVLTVVELLVAQVQGARPFVSMSQPWEPEEADGCAGIAAAAMGMARLPQSGWDLGERLRATFRTLLARRFGRIVVIGSDSPTLPPAHLTTALEALGRGA